MAFIFQKCCSCAVLMMIPKAINWGCKRIHPGWNTCLPLYTQQYIIYLRGDLRTLHHDSKNSVAYKSPEKDWRFSSVAVFVCNKKWGFLPASARGTQDSKRLKKKKKIHRRWGGRLQLHHNKTRNKTIMLQARHNMSVPLCLSLRNPKVSSHCSVSNSVMVFFRSFQ